MLTDGRIGDVTQSRLEQIFDRYNRRYWRGRLPSYQIIVSEKHWGSCCDRKSRQIYMHPVLFERFDQNAIRRTLLHEMAHAATQGVHGEAWQREMKRLHRRGAPVAPDDLDPELVDSQLQKRAMLDAFEEYGWESPDIPWGGLLNRLAYPMGLVTNDGKPVSKRAARFLVKCNQAFNRGVRYWKSNSRWKQSRHRKSSG